MQLTPYLGFNGQCQEAFKFYEKCLGGKITAMFTFDSTPAASHVPAEFQGQIMHARLDLDGQWLMGSDYPGPDFEPARGFHVSINVDTPEEAERIYKELSEGGKIEMPLEETFWAVRFGMFVDRFGTPWMINCEKTA